MDLANTRHALPVILTVCQIAARLLIAGPHAFGADLVQLELISPLPSENVETVLRPSASILQLSDVEGLALSNSPSMTAVEARVRAARWECVQAGLPPNPTVGYVGSEIGNEGAAGQQGAFFSQQFIRGGKLTCAQAVAAREAKRLEQELATERLRVLTDVRTAFYDYYLSQQRVALASELLSVGRKAAETAAQLVKAGEGSRTNAIQAEIEFRRAQAAADVAQQQVLADWRRVAAMTGHAAESLQGVEADIETLKQFGSWEETMSRVLTTSPQVASKVAAIDKATCQVAVERAAVVPDITAQLAVQYDDATNDTVTGVQVGMPLPLWNRNRGGIGRARAELTAARRQLEATEQRLSRQLAVVYGRTQNAATKLAALQSEVLPRARENLDLVNTGYQAGEVSFFELLIVQRTYFEVSVELLEALRELNQTAVLINGCLLDNSGNP